MCLRALAWPVPWPPVPRHLLSGGLIDQEDSKMGARDYLARLRASPVETTQQERRHEIATTTDVLEAIST